MGTSSTAEAMTAQEEMEREGMHYLQDLWNQDDTGLGVHEAPMDEGFNTW